MDYNNQNPYEQNSGTSPYLQSGTQSQDPYGQSGAQSQSPYSQYGTLDLLFFSLLLKAHTNINMKLAQGIIISKNVISHSFSDTPPKEEVSTVFAM
mgnify:CR=1 FL=1